MTDIEASDRALLGEHRRSFVAFERLLLFAVLHVALSLGCVALAFVGQAKTLALLMWLGGTATIALAIALHAGSDDHR